MSNYRPITDVWLLARCKYKGGVKRYGGYLGGFPERARILLGANIDDPVLHVCGGLARFYPYAGGFGPNDATLDLDPATNPDYLQAAQRQWPTTDGFGIPWKAALIDPPYSPEDAKRYAPGSEQYPSPAELLSAAAKSLRPGRRVGIIHYMWPGLVPGIKPKELAVVAVGTGRNGRARWFTVWEVV